MSKENFEAFSRTKKNMEKQGKTWNEGEKSEQKNNKCNL